MKTTQRVIISVVCITGCVLAATILPFGVKVGGLEAKAKNQIYAELSKPVAPDAVLEVDSQGQMIIVNIFPCDSKGTVATGVQPEIILLQGTNKVALTATMSKKSLTDGTYIMNIMAESKTARVLFSVKALEKQAAQSQKVVKEEEKTVGKEEKAE